MSRVNRFFLSGFVVLAGLVGGIANAASFTAGNLVVVRIGDGTAASTSASTAVFLDEYTPGGTFVQTIAMPVAAAGSNNPFTNSGTATSEGFLNLSVNGQYLVLAGYNSAPGTAAIATTSSTAAPRLIARVDLNGVVDTSTSLSGDTSYSAGNIRSATSNTGAEFWTAGTASNAADGGVRYIAALSANTSLQINTPPPSNTRVIGIASGQLYVTSASGTTQGVCSVGTGLPTVGGQTATILPGFPTATGPSNYDYFFADPNTLYVAEDHVSTVGGIQKWTLSAGVWTLVYTLNPTAAGCRGLTGTVTGGVATLYATTTQTSANQVVVVTDAGAGSAFTTVATAPANTAFRGLRILVAGAAPSPGSPYCFGDDSGTLCPCSTGGGGIVPPGATGNGCPNSINPSGAHLAGTGIPSVSTDTFLLTGSGMPNSFALYFEGTTQVSLMFGDGLRCAGGSVIRFGTKQNVGGSSQYPAAGDFAVHLFRPDNSGDVRTYQCWYRNPAAFCTASTFNLTNGWTATWVP